MNGPASSSNPIRRVIFWTAALLALLMAAHAFLDWHYRTLYEKQVAKAVKAGRLPDPGEHARDTLPPDENAMTALREAAAPLMERHRKNPKGDPSYVLLAYTPEIWRSGDFALSEEEDQMVSFGIASAGTALKALRSAERMPHFALDERDDTKAGETTHADDLTALYLLSRYAAARGWWESSRGNVSGACRWISSALALAARLNNEPRIVDAITRVNMGQNALTILKTIMERHPLPRAWEEVLAGQMEDLRNRRIFARAFAGEAGANTRQVMKNIDEDDRFRAYLTRPLARRFMCGLFDRFDAVIRGIEEKDTQKRLDEYALLAQDASSSRALPNLLRTVLQFEDSVARCDMLLLSMKLKRYKADHGSYPETLEALVPDYVKALPVDAHAADGYAYTREKEGFMLYSAGAPWLSEAAPDRDFVIICRFGG